MDNKQATVFCNEMDLTANDSQHSDNESNTSADLQHFPDNQTDNNKKANNILHENINKCVSTM